MARKMPNRTNVASNAPNEIKSGSKRFSKSTPSARSRVTRALGSEPLAPAGLVGTGETALMSVNRTLHAVDQVTHALERDVTLRELGACGDDLFARVVLERPRVDDHAAIHELGFGLVRLLFGFFGDSGAVRRHFDEALFEAAAHQVIPSLTLL